MTEPDKHSLLSDPRLSAIGLAVLVSGGLGTVTYQTTTGSAERSTATVEASMLSRLAVIEQRLDAELKQELAQIRTDEAEMFRLIEQLIAVNAMQGADIARIRGLLQGLGYQEGPFGPAVRPMPMPGR